MENLEEKLELFAELVEKETIQRLYRSNMACETNIKNAKTRIKPGKKYTKIDIGTSGRYMVVNDTGEIFGVKAYGVIHRGHYFGTLDEIDQMNWGDYRATKKAL